MSIHELNKPILNELEKYQTDHLILLIGGNPLPNAVAALCLAAGTSDQITGNITLVHSDATASVANNLYNWLRTQQHRPFDPKSVKRKIKKLQVDASHPHLIQQAIEQKVLSRKSGSIGLNYTGGTKTMSVHTYRAFEIWGGNEKIVYSYLDSNSLQLRFDQVGMRSDFVYVGHHCQLTIQDLVNLHGGKDILFDLDRPPLPIGILPNTATEICRLYVDGKQQQKKNWFQSAGKIKPGDQVDMETCPFGETLLQEVDQTNATHLNVTKAMRFLKKKQEDAENGDKLAINKGTLCKFLDNIWLEHYVWHQLNKVRDAVDLTEILIGVSPYEKYPAEDDEKEKEHEMRYEVDVSAMRGYQMFVGSCTLEWPKKGKKAALKQKLLEVAIRARQLGGDEARLFLVCQADRSMVAALKREIKVLIGTPVMVFGIDDWLDLDEKLEAWISKQIGDQI